MKDLTKERQLKLIKEIEQCKSVNKNCDYLLEHNDCDELIDYITKLEKELEQLKEIEKEHQRINGELRVENKELKKQLEEINYTCIPNSDIKNVIDKYKNQQKEFMEYLENEIKERKIQILGYHPTTQLLIEQIIETEKMVLSKYKEIIGDKE